MDNLPKLLADIGDPETRVRLVAQGKNLWRVRMLFPRQRAHEIPEQLRQIKIDLAHAFGVADHRLEYHQLLSKRTTRNGILVEMHIRRQEAPAGPMRVRFLPQSADDGTTYSDMTVVADLYPVDDYEKALTFESVEARIRSEGVDGSLVSWGLVRESVQNCLEEQRPLLECVLAEGELPDVGPASRLLYRWFPQSDSGFPTAWLGLRTAEQGEELLEHQPPSSGLRSGKNVFGRELSPRRGMQTRLIAGKGVVVGPGERKVVATEAGVIFFRREFADRRQKDTPCTTPHILHAEVRRVRTVQAEAAVQSNWDEPLLVLGTLPKGSSLSVASDCILKGSVPAGCQLQVTGNLRITGDVSNATLGVTGHLCVHGKLSDAVCEVGLTAQFLGSVTDSACYAREILADEIVGGTAEAYHQFSNKHEVVAFNREKFLAEHRKAGEDALFTLRRQMIRLYEIFGPEIVQQVKEDSVQMNLLRWLKQQKTLGIGGYTHSQVQEFRTLLEILPDLRREISLVAEGLRDAKAENTDLFER
ncbi:MAG: DUF342 domain-containing protein [Calditrichaeota bacterium]|nr:DUF342 domain-containing protein [Calditrichota bacterium]MCB9366766.1 DUF342 domain-containing protein [Calditrichota bacterium]MCB9391919.1 DUF342 domain-containing protein [Calditrichota bacterium]